MTGAVFAAFLSVVAADAPPRIPIDGVAALIDRRVVTVSEVKAEARLVLLEKGGPDLARSPVDDRLLAAVFDTLVTQELLAIHARRTGLSVRELDIDKKLESLAAQFPDDATARKFFASIGLDEESMRTRVRRDLAAAAVLRELFGENFGELARKGDQHEKAQKEAVFEDLLARIRKDVEVRVVWRP